MWRGNRSRTPTISGTAGAFPHTISRTCFTLSLNYDLPIGKGKAFSTGNRIADAVVGNWQTNAIFLARSGQPYSITADGDIANTGNTNYMRANVVGDPHQDNPTPDKWFNTAAFAIHAVYTYGNLGRNTMRSQNLWNLDLSVFRQFPIKERARFELRGEAFNLFNTVVYGIPGANISQTARFGHITSTANNPRSLQVGAKVIF